VPGDTTRPITDRAKEALFSILAPDLPGSSFLDLFAGTGSVGIEALSRGAAFVRFVDQSRQAVETVRANLKSSGLDSGGEAMRTDSFSMLERPADRTFDTVFIAPPQYKGLWKRALLSLDAHPQWLTEDAWVIVQVHTVEYEPVSLQNLTEIDQRRYGSVQFVFYERVESLTRSQP
jgi:16S rRNA (guanine(966)-N(2))-methyltransferase RsmD